MPSGQSSIDETYKSKDLTDAMVTRESAAKKTWFLRREDNNKIIAVEEIAASEMINNPQKILKNRRWRTIDYEIIGVSNGLTYKRVVGAAKQKAAEVNVRIAALQREQDKFRQTHEKMVFEDLVKAEDQTPQGQKLRRVLEIIAEYDGKLNVLEEELKKNTSGILLTAFDEELKVAMANTAAHGVEYPTNHNIITPGASPKGRNKIIRAMEGGI